MQMSYSCTPKLLYSQSSPSKKNTNQNIITMSQKGKIRRARREARQEKQAKMVITWIFAVLVLLALIFLVVFMMQQM